MEVPEGYKKEGNHFVKIIAPISFEPLILDAGASIFDVGTNIKVNVLNYDPSIKTVYVVNGSLSLLTEDYIDILNTETGIYEIEVINETGNFSSENKK